MDAKTKLSLLRALDRTWDITTIPGSLLVWVWTGEWRWFPTVLLISFLIGHAASKAAEKSVAK